MGKMKNLNSLKKTTKKEPLFNSSFFTTKNIKWFHFILNYVPQIEKEIVFLPCGRSQKNREKFGKKKISNSMSHQFMSAITRNNSVCRIIISEPLVIIPYEFEDHELRPDYNIPPDKLSNQSLITLIHRLSLYLTILKAKQPNRKNIFYCGSKHHLFVLSSANELANNPFNLIYRLAKRGLPDYALSASELMNDITKLRNSEKLVNKRFNRELYIKKYGKFHNKRNWKNINIEKNENIAVIPVFSELDNINDLFLFPKFETSKIKKLTNYK